MEISAPSKEAFMGPSRSMEPGIAGTPPSMVASCYNPEAFVEASAPNTEAFTEIPSSMDAQKPAAAAAISCERYDAGIFEKSREPLVMRKEGEELVVYHRKGRPIRRTESKKRTFNKRRNRLFKKAYELSVLCDAEVGAIVFSPSGKISEFASSSTSHIIRKYQSFQPQMPSNNVLLQDVEHRSVFEKNNFSLIINEVKSSEAMLKDALIKIRKRKSDLFEVEAQKIIEKGETLRKESNILQQKLTQVLSAKQSVSNASNERRLEGTPEEEDVYCSTD